MITIITGKVNRFKTTYMIKHYQMHQQGDGFVSVKQMNGNDVQGYDAVKLSTNMKKTLMLHERCLNQSWKEVQSVGPYRVNVETLDWINREVIEMMNRQTSPIYLDEIGQLELSDQGFDSILRLLLLRGVDLIIVVKSSFLDAVIKHY
ncbi:MAG: hypothetical protein IH571_00650, partial [Acholeplasmataceae bacterium]|nr:hypothetical protein [Acholeplasmataceae bacterium]